MKKRNKLKMKEKHLDIIHMISLLALVVFGAAYFTVVIIISLS